MSPVVNASAATFPAATAPAKNAPAVTIVQLTDTHLFTDDGGQLRGCHTNVTFRQVVARVAQMQPQPDLLLLTGDLAQDDSPGAYGLLRDALVPLGLPVYWVPGNHDQNLGAIEAVLGPVSLFSSPLSFRAGGWHVVLLWTMVPNQVQGRVADDRLAALERSLQEDRAGLPTLVALHHPLLPIGSAVMDAIGVENAAAVLAVLGSPSTCLQLLPGSPTAVWTDEPPGFRLLRLFADGRIETEIHYLNNYLNS
jgi:3',5'-cyclic-AMP phosphodiesterase